MDAAVDLAVVFHWPPGVFWDMALDDFVEWWNRAREILQAQADAAKGR